MNRMKVYDKQGNCVDSFTKPQRIGYYRLMHSMTQNQRVRQLNRIGYCVKAQLSQLSK